MAALWRPREGDTAVGEMVKFEVWAAFLGEGRDAFLTLWEHAEAGSKMIFSVPVLHPGRVQVMGLATGTYEARVTFGGWMDGEGYDPTPPEGSPLPANFTVAAGALGGCVWVGGGEENGRGEALKDALGGQGACTLPGHDARGAVSLRVEKRESGGCRELCEGDAACVAFGADFVVRSEADFGGNALVHAAAYLIQEGALSGGGGWVRVPLGGKGLLAGVGGGTGRCLPLHYLCMHAG